MQEMTVIDYSTDTPTRRVGTFLNRRERAAAAKGERPLAEIESAEYDQFSQYREDGRPVNKTKVLKARKARKAAKKARRK